MTRHSNINGFKMNDYYRTASIQDYFSTKTNKECILFPTYAKRNPNNRNEWIVKAKGWALSHNCSFAKQKVVMGITKSVAGKSFTDSTSLQTFEERFKYFLATNQKSKSFTIQAIDVIASLEMMNNFIPTFLLTNQHYILPSHYSSLSQQDEDKTDYPTRPQNPMASILDQLDIESSTPVDQDNSNAAIQLKTSNSGFFLGEFVLAHDTILAWAQAHNQRNARLIRIQSTSTDHTKSFSPTRGVVSLVESYGISIVSDIDDTIKDTRILAGARKVLSKTFFEQPKEVEGMSDVYMTWYNQGASFHYVSNSPFQLVPMLDQFIRDAHFPPGSMHLRDDLSLLSRLVEIPGQAKREAILDIIRDFPQRRFILIGDSGEIDLEIYTKIAFEYPKQVLKIFIRDVTTPLAEEQERKKMHKRMSQSSFLSTFSRRESLVDDDDLFTLQSQHSIPSSSHKNKFQSPLGLRKAVRSTLMEYAVEPHMTGHRTDFHMDGDDDIGLINPHRHHQISTAEACKRLYERVEKARLQIPNVDIVLFQDAQILQNDKYIQDALWNMKGVTDDTLSYRFFK